MRPSPQGGFEKVVHLKSGYHQYKFIVDGHWVYDILQSTTTDPFGNVNNQLYIPESKVFAKSISCGSGHTICVTDEGKLYGWGLSNYGQLGFKQDSVIEKGGIQLTPKLIKVLDHKNIAQVACGLEYSLFLDSVGSVYACGNGTQGQIGQGFSFKESTWSHFIDVGVVIPFFDLDLQSSFDPLPVVFEDDTPIVHISAGDSVSAAISLSGQLFTWGLSIGNKNLF